jgi:small subunit ribosomal protein S17
MKDQKIKKIKHRRFEGIVASKSEQKTFHVIVKTVKMHPKYKKQYSVSKKYAVHDEKNEANVGDLVILEECRPISKTKKWRLISVVKKA